MATFPTEEELARKEKEIELNQKILEQRKEEVQAMQDLATAKAMLPNVTDEDEVRFAQEALVLQQEAFAFEEKKRQLAAQGLSVNQAEEIAYQNKMKHDRRDKGGQRNHRKDG